MPVDLTTARRRAALLAHRTTAAEYIATQEARVEAIVRAAFAAAFAPVLDLFRTRHPLVAAAQEDPDPEAWAAAFVTADDLAAIRAVWARQVEERLVPIVADLFDAGAHGALTELDPQQAARRADAVADTLDDVLDFRARDFLNAAENRLVGIGNTAWTTARERLVEGFQAGEGIDALAGRVEEALDVAASRAVTIARTEVVSASNAGSIAGARALSGHAPPVKIWMASLDARTRESHADADGQEVALDEPFTVGGAQLDYPGDPAGPVEEVANCRCTIVYRDEPTPDGEPTIDPEGRQSLAAATEEPTMARRRVTFRLQSGEEVNIPAPPRRYAPGDPGEPIIEAVEEEVAEDAPLTVEVEVPPGVTVRPFEAIAFVEGRWTGDHRYVMPGAMRWDGLLPANLTLDHAGTVDSVVGYYGDIRRVPGPNPGENLGVVRGFFVLNPADPDDPASDVVRKLESGVPLGTSMETDDETIGGIDPASTDDPDDMWMSYVVEDARIRTLTVCPTGAFAECRITLDPEGVDIVNLPPAPDGPRAVTQEEAQAIEEAAEEAVEEAIEDLPPGVVIMASGRTIDPEAMTVGDDPATLVAASPPVRPPAAWFTDPGFGAYGEDPRIGRDPESGATGCALTITPEGRVFGHLAAWGTCHTGFPNQCVTPPRSETNYAMFHTGEVETAEGTRVPVGRLTMTTGHAPTKGPQASLHAASAHYDNTGAAVADVHAGEDEHGIWLAGAMRPGVTEEQFREAMASPPSGDWRKYGHRGRELIAALHVNAPGFPVPRATPDALVAAGVVSQARARRPAVTAYEGPDLRPALNLVAASIGRDTESRLAELRRIVHPDPVEV